MGSSQVMRGGCHCGAVRFEVVVRDQKVSRCDCSICTAHGFLHLVVPQADFNLVSGAQVLSTYRFGTTNSEHRFCRICGIHSFYSPRSHPGYVDVNVRCLDGVDLVQFDVVPFDERSWETNVEELRETLDLNPS